MLFPLSKSFSASSLFQKGGEHHEKPIHRVWTIDHTGSAERTKELHLLLTDQRPYKAHEQLATRRAQEGKRQDDARMAAWRQDLRDLSSKLDAEADDRREEMHNQIRTYRARNADSSAGLRQTLKTQALDHKDFLADMQRRVDDMPYIWGGEPIRETKERYDARKEMQSAMKQQGKDYQQGIKGLKGDLDNRGPQEWTAMPRVSSDTIIRRRKAQGLQMLAQNQQAYEARLEAIEAQEQHRADGERRELRARAHEANLMLASGKTQFLQGLADTHAKKKAEIDGIKARVEGRASGRPDHPTFAGYATAGYSPVHKSSTRLREHAAERADPDANHEEPECKTFVLSMPMGLRNRVVAKHNPRNAASLAGTGISTPKDWSEMTWTNRWALLSRHAPPGAVQKAMQKSGMESSGNLGEQRTLSPRTLGLATS